MAGGHQDEPRKRQGSCKSLGVVHEVVIEAFRSKEDEATKNATLSVSLVTNSS